MDGSVGSYYFLDILCCVSLFITQCSLYRCILKKQGGLLLKKEPQKTNVRETSDMFVARSLDEIRFLSRIMKEHSLFLRLGFRCEYTQLSRKLINFIICLNRLNNNHIYLLIKRILNKLEDLIQKSNKLPLVYLPLREKC